MSNSSISSVSLRQLLSELRRQGVRVSGGDGVLHVEAPKGVITPAARDLIRRHKAPLLEMITGISACDFPRSPDEVWPEGWVDAIEAWLLAGCPDGDPVLLGLELLTLKRVHEFRRLAVRRSRATV